MSRPLSIYIVRIRVLVQALNRSSGPSVYFSAFPKGNRIRGFGLIIGLPQVSGLDISSKLDFIFRLNHQTVLISFSTLNMGSLA